MKLNHTASIAIKHGVNSQAYYSFKQPETLILFVHGFGGHALGTWNNFSSCLLFDEHFQKTDILFYGYDTFKGQAGDHASELYHFINAATKPLQNNILPAGQALLERDYKSIILVAHSLGAILARQALLLAHIDKKNWLDMVSMALFAPAHHGANVIPLAMEALPGLLSLAGVIARFMYPILNDLNAKEEGIIKFIFTSSEKLQDAGKGEFTKAKLVVWAKGDKVVRNIQYLDDKPAITLSEVSHISVCKPLDSTSKPFEIIKELIK